MSAVEANVQSAQYVDFWNDILVPKFIKYKHILVDGGRRIGAVHHLGGFRGHRQHRLRAHLPDPGSSGVLRAWRFPDAGDPQDQHLAAGGRAGTSQGLKRSGA